MSSLSSSRELGPASPCINICVLGDDGLCGGCLRSLKEIAGWSGMSAAEQWALVARLDGRRAQRARPQTVAAP